MIIKKITDKKNPIKNVLFPIKENNIFTIKVDKFIEIVVISNPGKKNSHQDNVGIIIEENKILKILSKRYKNVSITKIKTKKDLEDLVKRKPDLVFSGVKYFNFNKKKLWLNDYLEIYGIPYIASSKAALDNESDKNKAKKLIIKAKVKTANFFITTPEEHQSALTIPISFPLFIKPVKGGGQ
jgi:D-alanine-D-alanine ligase